MHINFDFFFSISHSFIMDLDDFSYLNHFDQSDIHDITRYNLKKPPKISQELQKVMEETAAYVSFISSLFLKRRRTY